LYQVVALEFPEYVNWVDTDNVVKVNDVIIDLSEEDANDIDYIFCKTEGSQVSDIPSTNPVSRGVEDSILILNEGESDKFVSAEEEIRRALGMYQGVYERDCSRLTFINYYSAEFYWERSFPWLYPYACGGPGHVKFPHLSYRQYCKHVMMSGWDNRKFQVDKTWLFTSYVYEMRSRVGSVAYMAGEGADDINVEEMESIMEYVSNCNGGQNESVEPSTAIKSLMSKLTPFSKDLVGTPFFIANERKKLLSLISSPVIDAIGTFRWFLTFAPAEMYEQSLYSMLVKLKGVSDENANAISTELTKAQRLDYLRLYPGIAARHFHIKQDCLWECVINGKHQPLGDIVDSWRRVEFQLRGTPHSHNIVCVAHDGVGMHDVTSDDTLRQKAVKDIVEKTITSCLVDVSACDEIEENRVRCGNGHTFERDYNFVPELTYFQDVDDPRREAFDPSIDYSRDDVTHMFNDSVTATKYRHHQLANQMHVCCFTCFKYEKKHGRKRCRFHFPFMYSVECNATRIVRDTDRRNRLRIRVLPKRNNGNLNTCWLSALVPLAHGGNTDLQYISNTVGAAEYIASYISKAEESDHKLMKNILTRKLAQLANGTEFNGSKTRWLKSIGEAVLGSQEVSCYLFIIIIRLTFHNI